MIEEGRTAAHLTADRAFVVQFLPPSPVQPAELQGRVEHVVTGRAARFQSAREMVRFMATVLLREDAFPGQSIAPGDGPLTG